MLAPAIYLHFAQLWCLLGFPILLVAENWVINHGNSEIHWRQKGKMIGSINFAHLFIDMDIRVIQDMVEDFCNETEKLRITIYDNKQKQIITQTRKTLHNKCMRLLEDLNNIIDIWLKEEMIDEDDDNRFDFSHADLERRRMIILPQKTMDYVNWTREPEAVEAYLTQIEAKGKPRKPRQIIQAAIAIGVGIASVISMLFNGYQLRQLAMDSEGKTNAVVTLQDHEKRISVNEKSIEIIKNVLMDVEIRGQNVEYVEMLMRQMLAMDELEMEVKRIMHGIELLSQHRLSPSLIDTKSLVPLL